VDKISCEHTIPAVAGLSQSSTCLTITTIVISSAVVCALSSGPLLSGGESAWPRFEPSAFEPTPSHRAYDCGAGQLVRECNMREYEVAGALVDDWQ